MSVFRILLSIAIAASPLLQSVAADREWNVFVGTYTDRGSKGIYAYRFQARTGTMTASGLAAEVSNPSFLAVHPNQRFLYAVGENSNGTVSSFAIHRDTGMLTPLNTVPSKGSGPCHIAFDRTGKWLFVANYNNGSIAVFPIQDDGRLGAASASIQHSGSSIDRQRQSGPHAHSVNIAPDNRFLIVADLGLDETLIYRFDAATGALTPGDPPSAKIVPGSGPRHLVFSGDGAFAYLVSEMKASVTAMAYDRVSGMLTAIQTISTLPSDFTGTKSAAEIAIHPNGKFIYVSNRGHDSIAMFRVQANGTLTSGPWVASGGMKPRHFAIDPTGAFLFAANQDSDDVVQFRIDPLTGNLVPTGSVFTAGSPVSIVFAER